MDAHHPNTSRSGTAKPLPGIKAAPQPEIHILYGLTAGSILLFTCTSAMHPPAIKPVRRLMSALGRFDRRWYSPESEKSIAFENTAMGRPTLRIEGRQGPPVSFSRAMGRLWAAVANQGAIGIDVAGPEEFSPDYPFYRAFGEQELASGRQLVGTDTARAAALLWSVKESAVKAAGTGFHIFDPLDVRIGKPRLCEPGIVFEVQAGGPVWVWARPEGDGWLALASMDRIGSGRSKAAPCAGSPPAARCPSERRR